MKKSKSLIDPSIDKYYAEGNEKDRLSIHRLEKDRTLQILKKRLPPAPAVILDVGGAAGVYAFPLAETGYEVHLIDPIAVHIEQAKYRSNYKILAMNSVLHSAPLIDCISSSICLILKKEQEDIIFVCGCSYI
jgi:hypothetical protein